MQKKKEPAPFFRSQTRSWYLQLGKRQINLGRDKDAAWNEYHRLMKDRQEVEQTADIAVSRFLELYLAWVKDWRSEGTYEWYTGHLTSFVKHIGERLKLLKLHERHVREWIDTKHKGSSPNTIYGAIRAVQTAVRWGVKRGMLPKSPIQNVEKPQQEYRDVVIEPHQFEEMLSRTTDQQERDFFTVLWETGCRVQEIRRVEAKHFNRTERSWEFPRAVSKGKRVPRTVYLTDLAYDVTERLAAEHPTGPIFRNRRGKPWTKNAIRLRFRKLVKPQRHDCSFCGDHAAAFVRSRFIPKEEKQGRKKRYVCQPCIDRQGLEENMLARLRQPIQGFEGACAMSFRHSFATHALKNRVAGLTVSVLLGHRDTRMISRVYGHLEKDPEFLHEELRRARGGETKNGQE